MPEIITLFDRRFAKHFTAEIIAARIKAIAGEMNSALMDKNPVFIPVLNGAFFFAADLLKHINFAYEISFVKLGSYSGMQSTHNVRTLVGLDEQIEGRNIVVIEDIIDTGRTISELILLLNTMHVSDIKIATLILKPGALQYPVKPDYTGFEVEDDFLVGYGLDFNKLGRHYKEIYKLIEDHA